MAALQQAQRYVNNLYIFRDLSRNAKCIVDLLLNFYY